jgi:metal-sulfur cluster biosynthetic enzyme
MSESAPFSQAYQLRLAILKRLMCVIDPETGVDVVRMRLVEDLTVDDEGRVITSSPSSFLCRWPCLSLEIQRAVAKSKGSRIRTWKSSDTFRPMS